VGRALRPLALAAVLSTLPCALPAQEPEDSTAPSHWSLDLPVRGYGISFGNSARFTGLRINFRDAGLDLINGINLTLWKPDRPITGTVNGLAVPRGSAVPTSQSN
jgi:hypothetical protein